MDVQEYINNEVKNKRKSRFNDSDQLSLGQMILKLKPLIKAQKDRIKNNKDEAVIVYDFEYLFPTSINSWRGSYDELAMNFKTYTDGVSPLQITEFYSMLKNCIGKTFEGYKGGDYTMNENTPVWVANHGSSGNTAVIDIVNNDYEIIIITGYRDF